MNLTFQSSFNNVKRAASGYVASRSHFCFLTLSFRIDVDIKIDSMIKLQTEFENGAVVSASVQTRGLPLFHNLPVNDRFPTLTPSYKHSKRACESHISIYKQLLFMRFLLSFRCFSLVYLLVPPPRRPPRRLLLPAPLLSIPTLSDRH